MPPSSEYTPLPNLDTHEAQLPPIYSLSLRRRALSFTIVVLFILTVLSLGLVNQFGHISGLGIITADESGISSFSQKPVVPDFSNYGNRLQNLSSADLHFTRNDGRLIIIGDIHGMTDSFNKLLSKLNYDSTKDKLIHVGDIITKGTPEGSLAILSQFAAKNVSGVRGNHDQTVIEWRGWFDWVRSYPSGAKWFESLKDDKKHRNKRPPKKFPVPEDWMWDGEHCRLAMRMSSEHYNYLLSLPLVLHLPSLHTHVVHAGLLPHDPTRSPKSGRQPLSHLPLLSDAVQSTQDYNTSELRAAQEIAVVKEIPQNQDSWVNINMRSVLDNGVVTKRSDMGTPWAKLWGAVIKQCSGFGDTESGSQSPSLRHRHEDGIEARSILDDVIVESGPLVCHPFTVIYGHAAARGLDIKKWSFGLDSGCVYGRRLSAFVYRATNTSTMEDLGFDVGDSDLEVESRLSFGNNQGSTRIVSVSCP